MTPEIDTLKKLATQKITKGKLEALQKAHDNAYNLFERLRPKSNDEDTTVDFESTCDELESALSDLASAIGDLEMAEDKDEREEAIAMIEDALEQTNSAFDAVMMCAIIGATPRPAPAPATPTLDLDFAQQVSDALKSAGANRADALEAWVQSAGTPEDIAERKSKLDQLTQYIQNSKKPPPPSAP